MYGNGHSYANSNGYYPGNGYPGGYAHNGRANANGQGGGYPHGNGYAGGYPNGSGQSGGHPNRNGGYPNGIGQNNANATAAQPLNLQWTNPALQQVSEMVNDPRFRGDPKGWHERKVTDYVTRNVPEANRVRIRKPVHVGGQDPEEGEHITISCLTNNRPLGSMHVYT